jgi:two-component system, NarL family, response regulator NreC
MNKTRVLITEDHATVRAGLKLLLNSQPDMEVVGEASDGRAAVEMAKQLKPDVALMDVTLPEMNGFRATEAIKRDCPQVRVLALTRHSDNGYVQQLLTAGASGYVLKQSAAEEMLRAVRVVAAGGSYLDPTVTEKVLAAYTGRQTSAGGIPQVELTEREEEVLRLIAWGYSNKEIAARLSLSVKTVETHKANSMRKLGVESRIGVVRYALLRGWLKEN